jgi:hypothetical protein
MRAARSDGACLWIGLSSTGRPRAVGHWQEHKDSCPVYPLNTRMNAFLAMGLVDDGFGLARRFGVWVFV